MAGKANVEGQGSSPEPQAEPAPAPSERDPFAASLLLLSVISVAVGQVILSVPPKDDRAISWVIIALGLVGAFIAVRSLSTGRPLPRPLRTVMEQFSVSLGVSGAKFFLLLFAPFLSLAAWLLAGEGGRMGHPWLAVGAWVLSIAFVIASAWQGKISLIEGETPGWEWAFVVAFVALALLLRVPSLDRIPRMLTGDEGYAGLTAVEFLTGQRNNPFTTAWDSWPAMILLPPAASINFFGQTEFAIRFPAALAGSLTLLAAYPFARSAFGRKVGLISVAYLSTFHFHIHFSRIGQHIVWDGLFFALTTAALWNAWETGRATSFALTGLVLGLSMYFYATARTLLVALPLWFGLAYVKERQLFRERRKGLPYLIIGAMVVVLPLALFYVRHPEQLTAPYNRQTLMGGLLSHEAEVTGFSPLRVLYHQFFDSALAFTGLNLRSWYGIDYPMLLPIAAALFLLGLVFMLLRPLKLHHFWLMLWLAAGVGAGALSESTPAAQRYLFTAPAVATIVAIGLVRTWNMLSRVWPEWRLWIGGLSLAVLAAASAHDIYYYFYKYAPSERFGDTNTLVAHQVARFLEHQPPDGPVYFLGPPRMGYYSHGSLPYLVPQHEGIEVFDPIDEMAESGLEIPAVFIVLPERSEELMWLRQQYPGGRTYIERERDGDILYYAFLVREGRGTLPFRGATALLHIPSAIRH